MRLKNNFFVNAHIRARDSDCLSHAASCRTPPSVAGVAGGTAGRSPVHGTSSMLNWWLFRPAIALFFYIPLQPNGEEICLLRTDAPWFTSLCNVLINTSGVLAVSMENFVLVDFACYHIYSAE